MPSVYELRIHPGQRFGRQWLAAVERWVAQLAEAQRQQQLQRDLEASAAAGPTAGGFLTPAPLSAAAEEAPIPEEPVDMDDDDYNDDDSDYNDSQLDEGSPGDSKVDPFNSEANDNSTDSSPGADATTGAVSFTKSLQQHDRLASDSSDASSDDAYDMGLGDKEVSLLSEWYLTSGVAARLTFCKLWLFNNSLGDVAAAALAALLGAEALLSAVPVQRRRGLKPLWLRMEWNLIDAAQLQKFIDTGCAARGLLVDVGHELPVEQRTRTDSSGRELNLVSFGVWGPGLMVCCVATAAVLEQALVLSADGPLMLFVDTSALLSMLGCPGSVSSTTCCTVKLLQALAGSGRFGRSLPAEQQSFLVLADTVLKQLDSLKSSEGVGGHVRRFLDSGLDELGPKGADFLTVLAAHEGEGVVIDRQAAVAGSSSPLFTGPTGQKSDLAIIEVALFFRSELLAAAAAAAPGSSKEHSNGGASPSAEEAQPVILVTNDNGQLQLAKAHGLPAFRLAGAIEFEAALTDLVKSGQELSSRRLRQLMAPAATAGVGPVAQRSLQDDFDGVVSCLQGLLEAYEDLSGLLGRISMLSVGAGPGEETAVVAEIQQLLQEHQHLQPFQPSAASQVGSLSVLEAIQDNMDALGNSLQGWEGRCRNRHSPSRVLKWASSKGL
eukprot:gene13818-13939_t